jgi:hypothetical protein
VILLFVLLLTPPVQKLLTARVQHYLENKLHTKVVIGRISFGLSGKIGLNDIFIADKTNDTLVSGGSIRAHLNYLKLFSNEVRVKDLELRQCNGQNKENTSGYRLQLPIYHRCLHFGKRKITGHSIIASYETRHCKSFPEKY